LTDINGLVAFGAGLLSFFSPCILPLVPSYLVFVSGVTFDNYSEGELKKYRKFVIIHSLTFILGFSLVFTSLGLTTSFAGKFFFNYQPYIMRVGGLLLIVMGLYCLNLLRIPALDRERMIHIKERPVGFFGSFIVGITFGLGWTPCVGPALASILIIAGTSGAAEKGLWLLALYSAGLAIPFFVAALLFHKVFHLLNRVNWIARYASRVLGVLLIVMGFLLFLDYFGAAGAWLGKVLTFYQ
jgi:cytochrome c-type biogenesis protein